MDLLPALCDFRDGGNRSDVVQLVDAHRTASLGCRYRDPEPGEDLYEGAYRRQRPEVLSGAGPVENDGAKSPERHPRVRADRSVGDVER